MTFVDALTLALLGVIALLLWRLNQKMVTLVDVTAELEADDTAVLAALNALAQEIANLDANQTDPALVARLEKIHTDFVAALNPTPPPPAA
jgi:cell division protein FtsB